jgi:hypothetical protein
VLATNAADPENLAAPPPRLTSLPLARPRWERGAAGVEDLRRAVGLSPCRVARPPLRTPSTTFER